MGIISFLTPAKTHCPFHPQNVTTHKRRIHTVIALSFLPNVGYQNKEVSIGDNTYIIQTLCPVGTDAEETTLGQVNVDETWMPYTDFLGVIDGTGCNLADYTYVGDAWLEYVPGAEKTGWYDFHEVAEQGYVSTGCHDDLDLPLNAGFLTFQNSGGKIVFAGEVLQDGFELLSSIGDNAYTGNASPVEIDISDLVCSDEWMPYTDFVGVIDGTGCNLRDYTYVGDAWLSYVSGAECTGWYDFHEVAEQGYISTGCYNGKIPFGSGDGFMIFQNSGATISVPTAL